MVIKLPELSLVVLIGASGAGKSSFARRHFKPTEVLSSDFCRGLVRDDESALDASRDAFDVLHYIARKRLAAGLLTVVDATNVQREARAPLVSLAREFHTLPVAIVLNLHPDVCIQRNASRPERAFGPHVVVGHVRQLRRSLRDLPREGFRHVFELRTPEDVESVQIVREPLWNNLRHEHGPFDLIGDIHGCREELLELLSKLDYLIEENPVGERPAAAAAPNDAAPVEDLEPSVRVTPPPGRKTIFLGDLCDRGPDTPGVLRIVMDMVGRGAALCVPGNHDMKLMRALRGRNVNIAHGLAESLSQLSRCSDAFRRRVADFLDDLLSHYVLDDGNLVAAHAGMREEMQGRGSSVVRDFALYGETTGETDEFGLPVRFNWAAEYRGRALVVYGHTPVPEPQWLNNTVNIDTGCVFGGRLSALRYPEREIISVSARATYCEPRRPFLPPETGAPPLTLQQAHDDVLDMSQLLGKQVILTRVTGNVTLREDQTAAALEAMSRFAVNPKWLIYLPPTMSPCETSRRPEFLEHPDEALAYYRECGVPKVICEAKHMGSRAVVVVCRDEAAARRRFGVTDEGPGVCYTRTGRRFFDDAAVEAALLDRIRAAAGACGLWDELSTDWLCLDCELMPWSAKAQELLRHQYAAVGAAATLALPDAVAALSAARKRVAGVAELETSHRTRADMVSQYVDAYRGYCWTVSGIEDLRLAPFHLLASEGRVHADRDHPWHMQALARLSAVDAGVLMPTQHLVIDVTDPEATAEAVAWWSDLTAGGGEGMVVKPLSFIARSPRGVVQPAVKCRGREYLRIIYGPEYTAPDNLERLRARRLGSKRALALREFSLGLEALERFVAGEPLRRVHECVFGVLALESEPVDPRL